MPVTAQDIDRALTAAFRKMFGWCPATDEPPKDIERQRSKPGPGFNRKVRARRERVLDLYNSGASYKEIERTLDVTPGIVRDDLKALDLRGRLTRRRARR